MYYLVILLGMINCLVKETKHISSNEDQYCLSRDKNNRCKVCVLGYPNQEGRCQKVQNQIENCLIYTDENHCQTCFFHYTTQENNTQCEQIQIPNCLKQRDGYCEVCDNGVVARNGNCLDKSFLCENSDPLGKYCRFSYNYKQKKYFDEIISCKDRGVLTLDRETQINVCQKQTDEKLKNCLFYVPGTENICYVCRVNYFLDQNSICQKSSAYEVKDDQFVI